MEKFGMSVNKEYNYLVVFKEFCPTVLCYAWLHYTVSTVWKNKQHIKKSDDECKVFIYISSA